MDWNHTHLAAFRAVAEAGSFTRGAAALGVSQPAVSKQVAELERAAGVTLLERGRQRATLTEAGETLLPFARRVAETLAAAKTALADLSALRRGRLRIGATPTLATYFLPRALVYFRARFPAVEVSVDVLPAASLFDRVREGLLDTVLSGKRPDGPEPAAKVLMHDPLVPVCAKDHALAKKRKVAPAMLAAHRLVLRDGPRRTAGFVERVLRARGVSLDHPLRLPHTESVKQAILAGLGVGWLPRVAVADDLASGRLKAIGVAGIKLRRPYYSAEREHSSQAMRAFACVLRHAARGSLPPARR